MLNNINLENLTTSQGIKILSTGSAGEGGGYSLSGAGDVNGDGYDDFLIGNSRATSLNSLIGESYLIFGKSTGFKNINLTNFTISQGIKFEGNVGSDTGYSVSGAGDVNGDGYDDFLIGAPDAGVSYLIFGRKTGFTDIELNYLNISQGIKIYGAAYDDYTGFSVGGAGDVNDDGYDDFLIAAPTGYWDHSDVGAVYLIFGKNVGWAQIDLGDLVMPQGIKLQVAIVGDYPVFSVSGVGDVNGDGYDDFLIGVADDNNSNVMDSYLIFGKKTGWEDINLENLTISQGIKIQDGGYSVSNAGDVNGDGYYDFLIGAPQGGFGAGANYLIFGKTTGWKNINLEDISITQGIKIYSAANGYKTGWSVSGAGDVNKDGYDDILVGIFDGMSTGINYLIFGKKTGFANIDLHNLTLSQGLKIQGTDENLVSGAGDVNGDGYDDFLVGMLHANNLVENYLIFGNTVAPNPDANTGNSWVAPVVATVVSITGVAIIGAFTWYMRHHTHQSDNDYQALEMG